MSTEALLYPWTISGEACPVVIGALGKGKSSRVKVPNLDPLAVARGAAVIRAGLDTRTSAVGNVEHDDEES